MKVTPFCLLVYASLSQASAQSISISGGVYSTSGTAIPYVNIGIQGKKIGTITDELGHYKLQIPDTLKDEILTISCVGFLQKQVQIAAAIAEKNANIILEEKVTKLAEVSIRPNKSRIYKLGITARTPFIMTPAESYSSNDIIEQARLIAIKTPCKLINANIYLNDTELDSVTLRLKFYGLDNQLPGERLVEKSIISTFPVKKGWLTFELASENIYMNKDFVVSFEYLPRGEMATRKVRLFYGAKLGSSMSYMRKGSQGSWQKIQGVNTTIYVTIES